MAVFKREFVKKYNKKVWGFIGYIDGVKKRKFGFASEEKAQLAFYNARVRARESRAGLKDDEKPVTVKELIEDRTKRLPVPKGFPGHDSRKAAVRDLKLFLSLLPEGLYVTQLTTADTAKYRDAQIAAGKLPQTVFRELTNIQACLNAAREIFPSLDNWRPPARPKLKLPKGSRNRVISTEEAARLLGYLRRPRGLEHKRCKVEPLREYRARMGAADFFQLALQTAMRPDEIVRREWSHVLWQSGRLWIDARKTDEEGTIDLPESCMEMLLRRRSEQSPESRWLFPSDIIRGAHLVRPPTELLRRAAHDLKIPWGYADNGIVLYTTRHTATTLMLDAGHDIATVQAQTRHSTKQMIFRYAHATAKSRRAAATTLDSFGENSLAGSLTGFAPKMPATPPMPRPKRKERSEKTSAKT